MDVSVDQANRLIQKVLDLQRFFIRFRFPEIMTNEQRIAYGNLLLIFFIDFSHSCIFKRVGFTNLILYYSFLCVLLWLCWQGNL